ncbi:hypothetical protein GQ457_03G028240 [Hibiscus cannabinus]
MGTRTDGWALLMRISTVVEEEGSLYSEMIGPCLPGSELNNWIAEELPVIFKANTEFSDINGVCNIIPDSQVDFEQNPKAIPDYSDSEGSDYVPSEDEHFESELSEFIDSENDVSDAVEEDCDVNVNQSVQEDLGFVPNIACDSDDVNSNDDLDSLYSVSSDDSGSRRKNRKNLVFVDKEILKEAVRQYGRVHRFNMSFKKNDNKRVQVVCNFGKCPWVLWASKLNPKDPNDNTWQIKTMKNEHSCQRGIRNNNIFSSRWIAKTFLHKFKADFNYSIVSLQQDIREAYEEVYVCLPKCTRARKLARETVLGSYKDQYGKIYEYLGEVRHSNPGTTTICKLDSRLFVRMYVCYEGCKLGFKNHCRPFISIDGCFLKGYYQGYILAAVGIDADNCIYPIAVAAVEAETRDSWSWFLHLLTNDLDIVNSYHITFMSDKQKGLIEALGELLPNAEHRCCVRHLYSNFKDVEGFKGKALKDCLWKVARATTLRDFERAMAEMRELKREAYDWLVKKDPAMWSKSHFSTRSKCDLLLNNYSECFNKMILEARDKPILTMMEIIRTKMMKRISKKAEAAEKCTGLLCPKIQKQVDILIEQAVKCWPTHAGGLRYEVAFGPSDQYVVDLQLRECSCRKWALTGIPCAHVVSAILFIQERPESYVDPFYHRSTQISIYSNIIYPIRGANQ